MATEQRPVEPNGCTHCGISKPHGWQWIKGVGLHQWTRPTNEQIKARMQQRRTNRTSSQEG